MPSPLPHSRRRAAGAATAACAVTLLVQGCGGGDSTTPSTPTVTTLSCDDSLKAAFKPDASTSVLLVKSFKAGDAIALSGTPTTPAPPVAPADLCLVKLLVGPGNAGPATAPSTSAGIGIEVWLPTHANWNQRIRAYGSGGWAGSAQSSTTTIGGDGNDLHSAAAGKGYVVATSDHGHSSPFGGISTSFGMNPDGTVNTTL